MRNIFLLLCICLLAGMVACKKEKFTPLTTPPPGLGGDTWTQDSVDKFIYDSLTVPYNVAVYYKWLPGQLDFPSDITPPDASKVVPVLKALLNVAYAPYNQQTGSASFLRRYLPKSLEMAGSAEYLPNGARFLGQAEGGTAMLLYEVNYFSRKKADSNAFKQMMHTMHHEFGHILHQNVLYPVSFKTISTGYTGNWYNISDADARQLGFITSYAQAAPDEDFVEMISTMLSGGEGGPSGGYDEYEALLTQTGGPGSPGYNAIKQKEAVVVDYFQRVWKIDFYALRAKCRTAFVNYLQ
ncbi:MAG TPA: putative zinc-binding metallopeptidase [Puia sp.]|nr:putative zinc-binding metallopeptidase [Puia sp.]